MCLLQFINMGTPGLSARHAAIKRLVPEDPRAPFGGSFTDDLLQSDILADLNDIGNDVQNYHEMKGMHDLFVSCYASRLILQHKLIRKSSSHTS